MCPLRSRRSNLDHLTVRQAHHPGLWLDKYLSSQLQRDEPPGDSARTQIMREVAALSVPASYAAFFARWQTSLQQMGAQSKVFSTTNRLAVGLGAESVLESNITLHRTYGVPYIPGSALKGLAAAYARNRLQDPGWQSDGDAYLTVFGDTRSRGYVTFLDALLVPQRSGPIGPLVIDVLTVHHEKYYGTGEAPPADWDNPNPVSFLSATGSYLLALIGEQAWVARVFEILEFALSEVGIGAKTSSGYGRLIPAIDSLGADPLPGNSVSVPNYALRKKELLAETPAPNRFRGTITDVKQSFAFINPAKGGRSVFVHESQVVEGGPLQDGQVVEYALGPGIRPGTQQAIQVKVLLQPNK